ncbi:flagellin [Arthrobacter alpinus]|uniref:flagellin N-terminal helical domain-containing protein n=1 Tax=Arthrobacter alpinus TaxID=656366 RepID=UPI001C97FB98|nr:flagellin [Arthrobacter alpinus]
MGMQVNTNIAANNAYRNLSNTQNDLSKSLEKLSSGLRINRAADDAAGLAISEGLKAQVNGSTVAARNAQDGNSVIQTAEGALTEVHTILQRMRDLAVQGSNDSNNADSRTAITTEANQLAEELGRITENTNFNGLKLLNDSVATMNFQVGAGGLAADNVAVKMTSVGTEVGTLVAKLDPIAGTYTAQSGFDVTSHTTAQTSVVTIDTAIKKISTARSELGASQNRMESASRSLAVSKENLSAAASRITDTDMAEEMVKFTRANILSQAGTAMLAQANQSNQGVLKLLG